MKQVNRRTFIKQAGGILLPVAAGLPLVAKAQLNQGLPRSGSWVTQDGSFSVFYFLDSVNGKLPHGALHGPGNNAVEYGSVSASGNTIYLSSARPSFNGAQVPYNCREISLTITEYSSSDDPLLFIDDSTGRARLRLSDGTVYAMTVSVGAGCFLTTACTAARGLPDNCMELQTLRTFRDSYMKTQASDGPAMIREYYQTAPAVVSAINAREDAAEIYDWMYRDLVVPSVWMVQSGQNAQALDYYAKFFMNLCGETL